MNPVPERRAEPEESVPIFRCDDCGEGIYHGDGAFFISGLVYCEECAEFRFRRLV
ncbi:hypothetical protein SAMN02745168_0323 [Papillibacter cinnamivorans DSM 12816]|uniref:Uncharacterized protein n=2 Tax=Papillibacter TaxID=100175 RepID=A0A1W2D3B8_9FIRM|nr:hypothetical protein SAMN02745168_0323 [Papillibacter cinnamivorans DSM 12816]